MRKFWKLIAVLQLALAPALVLAAEKQTIVWIEPTNTVLEVGRRHQLAAEASSKLPVRYKLLRGSATLRGSLIEPHQPGEALVLVEQPGNATWSAARIEQKLTFVESGKVEFVETFEQPLHRGWVRLQAFGTNVIQQIWSTNGFLHVFHAASPAPETLFTVAALDLQSAIFTDVEAGFDFWDWETRLEDSPVIMLQLRVSDPRGYRADWYAAAATPKVEAADPAAAKARTESRFTLLRVKGLGLPDILALTTVEKLDPRKRYRVHASAKGTVLTARLTDLETGKVLGELTAVDDKYKEGFCALMILDRSGVQKTGNYPVQLKADNFRIKGTLRTGGEPANPSSPRP